MDETGRQEGHGFGVRKERRCVVGAGRRGLRSEEDARLRLCFKAWLDWQ